MRKSPAQETHTPSMGELETDVMRIVWDTDWISVREVFEALHSGRSIAYTTVMTVMGRLHEKGMLERRSEGRTHVYRALHSRVEVARSFMRRVLARLFDGRKADAVAALLDEADTLDAGELARVKRKIRELEAKSNAPSRRGGQG